MSPASAPSTDPTPVNAPTAGFVHLHVHTEFSAQDGLARLGDVSKAAAADGQIALAMTDHGSMAGSFKFHAACEKAGVLPIFGVEAYVGLVPDGSETIDTLDEELIPPHIQAEAIAAGFPAVYPEGVAWDDFDPRVRFAKHSRMSIDAESGKAKRQTNHHLTLLAESRQGWRNLCALVNAAEESFYHKPRIDYALLKKHSEGIIVLSGCLGGPVASRVAAARSTNESGDVVWDDNLLGTAGAALDTLIAAAGPSNVFVEVMEHGLKAEGWEHILMLGRLAKSRGVGVVASNDSHFTHECDCDSHDSWLALGEIMRGADITKHTEDRWRFNGEGYWLRTEAEMRALYPDKAGWQRACDTTVQIAERIRANHEVEPILPYRPGQLHLPVFPHTPEAVDAHRESGSLHTISAHTLRLNTYAGLRRRYHAATDADLPPEVVARAELELGTIRNMGLDDYFLIVADVLDWARSDLGLPELGKPGSGPVGVKKPILIGPGRGSAAGSIVAYSLRITEIEPLANGLLFERFLDPSRLEMPDIDVDFEAKRRDEVFAYATALYGSDHVCRIGAMSISKTKRSIKDAARVLGFARQVADDLNKLVPTHQGQPHSFAHLFEETLDKEGNPILNPQAQPFREAVAHDPGLQSVVELARAFEDVVAGFSIHAAGVLISDEPIHTLLPLRADRRKDGDPNTPIAQWDGKDLSLFGMLKLDALSLKNLDIIASCFDHIETTTGRRLTLDDIPSADNLDDPTVAAAFSMLREGRTAGVFQLESSGMTELCTKVAPTAFNDLSALVALYRPGPLSAGMDTIYARRKNGHEHLTYDNYTLDPAEQAGIQSVLDDTLGVICYQEQLMTISEVVAGFDMVQKNKLRTAFSKKDKAAMDALYSVFIDRGQQALVCDDGSSKMPYAAATLESLWVTFQGSAEYLFNRAHSAAYGHVAYITAWLKANHPVEYASGLLGVMDKNDKKDKRGATLKALKAEGITVHAPDVNISARATSPDPHDPHAVRIGLGEIAEVGNNADHIIATRNTSGLFSDLHDLRTRVRIPGKPGTATAATGSMLSVGVVIALIEAGALDGFGERETMMAAACASATADLTPHITAAPWGNLERTLRQRLRIGFTTGELICEEHRAFLRNYRFVAGFSNTPLTLGSPNWVTTQPDQTAVAAAGVVTALTGGIAKRSGRPWAKFTLEASNGAVEVFAHGGVLERIAAGQVLRAGALVAISGKVARKTDTMVVTDDNGEESEVEVETVEVFSDRIEILDPDQGALPQVPETPEPERVNVVSLAEHARAKRAEWDAAGTKTKPTRKTTAPVAASVEPAPATGASTTSPAPSLVAVPDPVVKVLHAGGGDPTIGFSAVWVGTGSRRGIRTANLRLIYTTAPGEVITAAVGLPDSPRPLNVAGHGSTSAFFRYASCHRHPHERRMHCTARPTEACNGQEWPLPGLILFRPHDANDPDETLLEMARHLNPSEAGWVQPVQGKDFDPRGWFVYPDTATLYSPPDPGHKPADPHNSIEIA